MAAKYQFREIVSDHISNELGDFVAQEVAERGTSKLAGNPRITLVGEMTRCCLANFIEGFPEAATIVHIPMSARDGKKLNMQEWLQAFWFACNEFGVPVWTQSGIKALTFVFLKTEFFAKMAKPWNKDRDGARFAPYFGLVLSEMDRISEPMVLDSESLVRWQPEPMNGAPSMLGKGIGVPSKGFHGMELNSNQVKFNSTKTIIPEPDDGQDGSCQVDGTVWGERTCQFRAMTIGKTTVVMQNRFVGSSKPLKMWISCEPILMLKDTKMVRAFLTARVRKEVGELLSLLTEERRADLLRYLGSLKLDDEGEQLQSSRRAVEDALRSAHPWCKEIEERVTRFAISLICQKIIPSGGIQGWAAALVMSTKYGKTPCSWEDASALGFRLPLTQGQAIMPFDSTPYRKGRGMVVQPEVAKIGGGDDDSDLLVMVADEKAVDLFRHNIDPRVVGAFKPDKVRADRPLSRETLEDMAIEGVSRNWHMGVLNVSAWKFLQVGKFEIASKFLAAAESSAMPSKWDVRIDGKPFDKYVIDLLNEHREELAGISLQWRDMAGKSGAWKSPRELANARIEKPGCLIDACWNAGVDAACEWAQNNPLKPVSLAAVARVAFGHKGLVIPASAYRDARGLYRDWGKYWAMGLAGDHGPFYDMIDGRIKAMSKEAVAAILLLVPYNPESNPFPFKWRVFAAGRGAEVLGLHPQVEIALYKLFGNDEEHRMQYLTKLVEGHMEPIADIYRPSERE